MKTNIVLGGKVADSLKNAFKFTEKNMKSIAVASAIASGTTNAMGKAISFASKTIAIGTAAAAAGLIALGNEAINTADKIGKIHKQTGLSMDELQRLEYMSTQLNFNFESIGTAVNYLNRNMASAASGSKDMTNVFKKMGVAFEVEGKLRNQADVFKESIFYLAQMEDEAERNAMAFKLFGRGAAELFPLLEAGTAEMARLAEEAEKLGIIMTDEQIEALDQLGDTIDMVKRAFKGMGINLITKYLPAIQEFADKIVDNMPAIEASFKRGVVTLDKFGDAIFKIISFVGRNWSKIETVLVFLGSFLIVITLISNALKLYAARASIATAITTFLASPIFLAALAIATLITVIYLLYKNWDKVSNFLDWSKIEPVLVFLGLFLVAITLITKAMAVYAFITNIAAGAMAFLTSPIFLTALAIAAVITALYLLYKNWDKVSNFLVEKWETYVMPHFNAVADFFEKLFGDISSGIEKVTGFFKTSKTVDVAARVESMPRFAQGGFTDRPSIFGDDGPEAAIPLKRNKRSLGLLNRTAQMLGGGNQGIIIHYSPVINGGNRAEIQTALDSDKPRFRDFVQSALAEQRRIAFDG